MKNKNRLLFWLLGFLLFAQCTKNNVENQRNSREVVDVEGRKVLVPENVERVIGVNAGAMRFLSYMSAIPNVVGVEEREHVASRPYNLAFPEIKTKAIIGPQPGGDEELILKAQPDVVFWSGYATSKGSAQGLQDKINIPTITLKSGELGVENDEIYNSLRVIGKTLKKEDRAEELISYIKQNMSELQERTKGVEEKNKPSVYVGGLSFNGSRGLGSTRANFAPFMLTNAKNVVANLDYGKGYTRAITIDLEKLIEWNPDYIFIDSDGWLLAQKEIGQNKSLYQTLKAFRNNQVYIIPRYINNSTSYDYAIIDAWYVGKVLYPERFKDIDIEEKSKEILEKFYNKKIDLKGFDLEFKQIEF
ncbi:MAG: ABC transporter substrate-binding protein [Flavobacteriaceae bacterium]|nr:ABC transporter substrate-binding protein [Flavobacteriaceae bacterium]